MHLIDEVEWRYKDRPTIQLSLPYIFIADEPVYLTQLAPFMHYSRQPMPGTIFGGRFPVNIWPRPLQWAFEWHDLQKPLILKRGEPLFYVLFETTPQERAVQVVEAQDTPELRGLHRDDFRRGELCEPDIQPVQGRRRAAAGEAGQAGGAAVALPARSRRRSAVHVTDRTSNWSARTRLQIHVLHLAPTVEQVRQLPAPCRFRPGQ